MVTITEQIKHIDALLAAYAGADESEEPERFFEISNAIRELRA